MINPTEADIGRKVVYPGRSRVEGGFSRPQVGIITSFNEKYIFVRYGVGATSAATKREDLEWEVA